jgi:hypothetical protein
MPDIFIPQRSTNQHAVTEPVTEIWIGGRRRPDAVVETFDLSAGAEAGTAEIEIRSSRRVQLPYDLYDAALCYENDLVEIRVQPSGVLWRGTITGRKSGVGKLSYLATCLLEKLNTTYWPHEYNFKNELENRSNDLIGVREYAYTARQIAADASLIYATWRGLTMPDDPLIEFALDTFPAVYTRETNIEGQGLLEGLKQVLEDLDQRWRIGIVHEPERSIVHAFLLGQTARTRTFRRGQDPDEPFYRQPGGQANAAEVSRKVDVSQTVSHVYAEGARRIVESAILLSPNWDEVADDFTPPEGRTLTEYVTVSERNLVINDWEKYTRETLDGKLDDNEHTAAKVKNPNYRRKYERVGTDWSIPKTLDYFYYNDDPESYAYVLGEERQAKIEGECVQLHPDGKPLDPFIVYKRVDSETLYATFDGFTVRDSKTVEFSKPFVDRVNAMLGKGKCGTGGTYNAESKQSTYTIADAGVDLTDLISDADITAGAWLVLGQYVTCYKLVSRTSTIMTVKGNTSGAGGTETDGSYKTGAQWLVTTVDPVVAHGTSGTGAAQGVYRFTPSAATPDNEYADDVLVLGAHEDADQIWTAEPSVIEHFSIVQSLTDSGTGLIALSTDANKSLAASGANWMILRVKTETCRPYERVWLNTAWESIQRLAWASGDIAPLLKNKRRVTRREEDYQWRTQYYNFQLVKRETEGEEDIHDIVFNPGTIEYDPEAPPNGTRKDLAALQLWAEQQLAGANQANAEYDVTIVPIDWGMKIGDMLTDTNLPSGTTVTGISYDLPNNAMTITAASRD